MKRGSYTEKPMKASLLDFGLSPFARFLRDELKNLGLRLNRGREYAWLVYSEVDGKLRVRIDTLTQLKNWIHKQQGTKNGLR